MKEEKKLHIPWIRTIMASQSLSRYGHGIILTVLCCLVLVIFDQIRCDAMPCMWYTIGSS